MPLVAPLYVSRPAKPLLRPRLHLEWVKPFPYETLPAAEFVPEVGILVDGRDYAHCYVLATIDEHFDHGATERRRYIIPSVSIPPGGPHPLRFDPFTPNPNRHCSAVQIRDIEYNQWYHFPAITWYAVYLDAACTAILSPPPGGVIHPGTALRPTATIRNLSSTAQRFGCSFKVLDAAGNLRWAMRTLNPVVQPGASVNVSSPTLWTAQPAGAYKLQASSNLALDANRANDLLEAPFTVELAPYRDVRLDGFSFPWSGIKEFTRGQPYGAVSNRGRQDVQAHFKLQVLNAAGAPHFEYLSDAFPVPVGGITYCPGPYFHTPTGNQMTVEAWAILQGDERPADNHFGPVVWPLTPRPYRDVACIQAILPEPGQEIELGAWSDVSARFRNEGRVDAQRGQCVFDGCWKLDRSEKLSAGVAYFPWGTLATDEAPTGRKRAFFGGSQLRRGRCLAKHTFLGADDVPDNNTLWTEIRII